MKFCNWSRHDTQNIDNFCLKTVDCLQFQVFFFLFFDVIFFLLRNMYIISPLYIFPFSRCFFTCPSHSLLYHFPQGDVLFYRPSFEKRCSIFTYLVSYFNYFLCLINSNNFSRRLAITNGHAGGTKKRQILAVNIESIVYVIFLVFSLKSQL